MTTGSTNVKLATRAVALCAASACALVALACGAPPGAPSGAVAAEVRGKPRADAGYTFEDDAAAPPAPGTGACESLPDAPASCWDWKFNYGFTNDGCYVVDPDGAAGPNAAFQVHCGGMDSYSPADYVDLVATAGAANTSVFSGVACGCVDYAVSFDKVRLDLLTMTLRGDDRTFATTSNPTCIAASTCSDAVAGLGYGSAGSCNGAGDASGTANVDLTGTPFHIPYGAPFTGSGVAPGGTADVSADRKSVTITGGGACGTFGSPAIPLELD